MLLKHNLPNTYINIINAKDMIIQDSLRNSEVDFYYTDKFDPHVLNNMLNISILASSENSEILTG